MTRERVLILQSLHQLCLFREKSWAKTRSLAFTSFPISALPDEISGPRYTALKAGRPLELVSTSRVMLIPSAFVETATNKYEQSFIEGLP